MKKLFFLIGTIGSMGFTVAPAASLPVAQQTDRPGLHSRSVAPRHGYLEVTNNDYSIIGY